MIQPRSLLFTTTAVCAFLCASGVHAQTSSPGTSPHGSVAGSSTTSTHASGSSGSSASEEGGFVLGTKIAGCHVRNQQNNELGTINDIVVNPETGRIRFAVVNTGSGNVAVPWSALNPQNVTGGGTPHFVLNATKQKLQSAPKFDPSKLDQLYSRSTQEPVFTYFDIIYFPDVLTSEEQNASPSR